MTMEILCVGARVIPGEWELKFPLSANRNLTLSITPQSPPGSTAAGPRRKWLQMSFTLLFSSYLFHFFRLPCSHIFSWCWLSMAAAWVAPVAEILIRPTTAAAAATTRTPAQKRHHLRHLWAGAVVWDLSSSTSSHASFCSSCQFPVRAMWCWGPAVLQVGCGGEFLLVTILFLCRCLSTGASTLVQTFELDFVLSLSSGSDTLKTGCFLIWLRK